MARHQQKVTMNVWKYEADLSHVKLNRKGVRCCPGAFLYCGSTRATLSLKDLFKAFPIVINAFTYYVDEVPEASINSYVASVP